MKYVRDGIRDCLSTALRDAAFSVAATFNSSVSVLSLLKAFLYEFLTKMIDKNELEGYRQVLANIYDYKSEMKRCGVTVADFQRLREMSLSSQFIPRGFIDFGFYIFFINCEKNFEKTLTLLHNYFKLVKDAPEFFDLRDCESPEVKASLENQFYLVLPPTSKNYNVIYHHMSNYDPKTYIYDHVAKTFLMTAGKDQICLVVYLIGRFPLCRNLPFELWTERRIHCHNRHGWSTSWSPSSA
jgi:hypothetical protein